MVSYLSLSSNTTFKSSERNNLFLGHNIFEVSICFADMHVLNSLSCLSGVFEVHTKVWTSCLAWFCCVFGFCWISTHLQCYNNHDKLTWLKFAFLMLSWSTILGVLPWLTNFLLWKFEENFHLGKWKHCIQKQNGSYFLQIFGNILIGFLLFSFILYILNARKWENQHIHRDC